MIPPRHSRSGFALVIVLGILVLLVALVIGFLLSAATERTAASSYKSSVFARQLADTAVSVVQGQINVATTQGSNVAWASQPGMVRTFDSGGALINAYKLYSAPNMISSTFSLPVDAPPANWAASPATWTDLNAPVEVNGTNIYPILDPSATADGFSITAAPGATANQGAPMPVQWLYVLQDGSLVASTGSGNTATVAETSANPIVGRVAFWTDDESCKVNINTASEGTYWDVPRAQTAQEQAFANFQPAQNEFQRYPGHPAMVCLSNVLFPNTSPLNSGATTPAPLTQSQYDAIYSIVPRIIGGGSTEGTVMAGGILTPDSDRLYANIEELIFNPARGANTGLTKTQLQQAKFFLTAHSRAPETNLFNLPRIACWPIDSTYDPKTNPTSPYTTAFDRLIAFCSTVGDTTKAGSYYPYYFQRHDSTSPTNDIAIPRNVQLYSYLQYLTGQAIPGFGGNFLSKYSDDRNQILTEMFDYIRSTNLSDVSLTAGDQFTPPTPTAVGSFPPAGHGFVAATHYTPPGSSITTQGFGRDYTLSSAGIGFICNADGNDPAPGTVNDVGFNSNNPTAKVVPVGATNVTIPANLVLGGVALKPNQKYIQAIFIPEFFSVMAGFTDIGMNMQIQVSGLNQLSVTCGGSTVSLFSQVLDTDSGSYTYYPGSAFGGFSGGGNPNWKYFGYQQGSPARGNIPADALNAYIKGFYPFIGTPGIITAPAGSTMAFTGGTVTVKIYSGATSGLTPANLIQTINLKFPSSTFAVPSLVTTTTAAMSTDSTATTPQNWWSFSAKGSVAGSPGRLNYIAQSYDSSPRSGTFLLPGPDVLQTVLPAHGDFRLVAGTNVVPAASGTTASPTVPGAAFFPHRYYGTKSMASNLTNASDTQYLDPGFDTGGRYNSALTYSPGIIYPDIPSNVAGDPILSPQITGDFDDYLPHFIDGPFINKPDEGSRPAAGTTPYFYSSHLESTSTFFSPNREIPSPGMFGSLPTGVVKGVPWQTLLFRHQLGHFGATSPEDHLFMDLFWMPVVEPYAISDRFSTAGKINMNYQILPFTYIKRSTGLQALFKSEMVAAVPNADVNNNTYKSNSGTPSADKFRLPIDSNTTLSQFDTKFSSGDIFKSASEICDMDIIPQGQTVSSMSTFWTTNAATAENLREKIYTTLYPRLTTKSNTFTVHFLAQALKKIPGSAVGTWTEGRDAITGEYRGSAIIERFINATNTNIPDYAAGGAAMGSLPTLDTFYKWRVISNRQFAP